MRHMAEIVVCYLVADHEGNLLIGCAKFVEPSGEVDIAPWRGEGRAFLQPRNFHKQTIRLRPSGLQAVFDAANSVNRPGCVFEPHRLSDLPVKPLPKTLFVFKLKVVSHR